MSAKQEIVTLLAGQYLDRALDHARRGHWEASEGDLERVRSLQPTNPEVPLNIARIRYHQGERQQSLNALAEAERHGGMTPLIAEMRSSLLMEDRKRVERARLREVDRRMRAELRGRIIDGFGDAFVSLTGREAVYVSLCFVFLVFVVTR